MIKHAPRKPYAMAKTCPNHHINQESHGKNQRPAGGLKPFQKIQQKYLDHQLGHCLSQKGLGKIDFIPAIKGIATTVFYRKLIRVDVPLRAFWLGP